MNGLQINEIALFLGKIPGRKQECFYFSTGSCLYPVAYINKENLPRAKQLWAQFVGDEAKDELATE